jgi:hypothetical protein
VFAELVAGFDAFAGDARNDPAPAEPVAQRGNVVALSACSLTGFRRRGPRRDRIAGSALTKGLSAWLSWVLAAEIPTVKGRPDRSDRAWIFEPGLPRSTGLGPVSPPPFLP